MDQDAPLLIEKFWAGTATPAEQQQLLGLLDAESVAWLLPDDGAAADPTATPITPLSPEQSARVLRRLHWRLALDAVPTAPAAAPAPRPRLRAQAGRGRWVALAALVLGLTVGLGWWLTRRLAPVPPPLARQAAPPLPAAPPAADAPPVGLLAGPTLVRRINPGPDPLRLPLPDGSVATLDANSTLTYKPFGPTSRELSLRGAALFAVAKDAARPFTVEAGGFTTTALGTRFRVVSRAGGRVTVRLLRGRVVVRATAASAFAMQPQYLTPGRELSADTRTQEVRLGAFDSVAAVGRARPTPLPAPRPRPADLSQRVEAAVAGATTPPPTPANQGQGKSLASGPPPLVVWVCTWYRQTYTSPKQPTSFEPDKCPRNAGKAHAWHKKYPYLDTK